MKAILISVSLLAPLAAMAADENRPTTAEKAEKRADAKAKENPAPVATDLSQSQLLDKLHKVSTGHTEMGNLAQTHAKSDKVKTLGEKMAKDFSGLDQHVIGYAKDHDIVLSAGNVMGKEKPTADQKAKMEKFSNLPKLQGEEFDKTFLAATIDGCQKFIGVLEGAKGKFDDMKFDRVLSKAIDTMTSYQRDAEKLQKDYAPAS
ncbi:MAG: DUF4142 domain-containing protein [Archangiaceae bacterium]|nr:DUF4142 domain-containing protein [Archangiaceae bacterium]